MALGTNLKFYTSLSKWLKLTVRKFSRLILTFVEVTGEKLVGGTFLLPPAILNMVKVKGTVDWANKENVRLKIRCSFKE